MNATYPHLLDDPEKIIVRSTNLTRTLESAGAQLRGIYGTDDHGVNIATKELKADYLLYPMACPRLFWLGNNVQVQMSEHEAIMERIKPYEDVID
jgi:hypothetical protein